MKRLKANGTPTHIMPLPQYVFLNFTPDGEDGQVLSNTEWLGTREFRPDPMG